MTLSFSIYQTKARLSELLRLVKNGRELTVTERGEPIAKLVPFHESDNPEKHMLDLAASGKIRLGKHKPFKVGKKIKGALGRFLEDRE